MEWELLQWMAAHPHPCHSGVVLIRRAVESPLSSTLCLLHLLPVTCSSWRGIPGTRRTWFDSTPTACTSFPITDTTPVPTHQNPATRTLPTMECQHPLTLSFRSKVLMKETIA